MNFIKYHKLNYIFFIILILATIGCLLIFKLNLGIDFLGGTLWEISLENRPENFIIQEKLNSFNLGEIVIQPTDNNGVLLRFKDVNEDIHQAMLDKYLHLQL